MTIALADIPSLEEEFDDPRRDRMVAITRLADRVLVLDAVGDRPQDLDRDELIAASARRARGILNDIDPQVIIDIERELLTAGIMRAQRFEHWVCLSGRRPAVDVLDGSTHPGPTSPRSVTP